MTADIRLSISFFRHHKTRRLTRRLGNDAVMSLVKLFCYAGEHRDTGTLQGMDAEDIADASEWTGDSQEYVSVLCEIGFLNQCDEGVYSIHEWEEHNPWAAGAEERRAAASKAGKASAESRKAKKEAITNSTDFNAPLNSVQRPCNGSSTPLPSPIPTLGSSNPSPKDNVDSSNPSSSAAPTDGMKSPPPCPVSGIIQAYHAILPDRPAVRSITSKLKEQIQARWKEDKERQSLGWWESFFQDVRSMPWLMGQGKWAGCNLHWLTGKENMSKVLNGQYQARAPDQMGTMLTRQGQKNYQAGMEWLAESGAKQ